MVRATLEGLVRAIWDFARQLNPTLDPVLGEPDPGWRHIMRSLIIDANNILDGYGTAHEFQEDWKWVRIAIPLQVRLIVEQILWDRGGSWKKLVTAFKPINKRPESTRAPRDSYATYRSRFGGG